MLEDFYCGFSCKTHGLRKILVIYSLTVYNESIFTQVWWPYVPIWLGPLAEAYCLSILIDNTAIQSHKHIGLGDWLYSHIFINQFTNVFFYKWKQCFANSLSQEKVNKYGPKCSCSEDGVQKQEGDSS